MCCGFLAAPGRPYAGSLSGRKPNQGQSPPRSSRSLSLHSPLLECRGQGLPTILLQALFLQSGERLGSNRQLSQRPQAAISMLYSPRVPPSPQ